MGEADRPQQPHTTRAGDYEGKIVIAESTLIWGGRARGFRARINLLFDLWLFSSYSIYLFFCIFGVDPLFLPPCAYS